MSFPSDQYEWDDKDTDEINSIDSEELHETRPNRWTGPPSTWRKYTRPDREIYYALEDVQNQDLSIHLYNAFALKRKIDRGDLVGLEDDEPSRSRSPSNVSVSTHSSTEWEDVEDGARRRKAWRPSKWWTAWPLPAEDIPPPSLLDATKKEGDGLTTCRPCSPSASRELEGEISATILRFAKEKFLERTLESEDEEEGPDENAGESMDVDGDGENGESGQDDSDDDGEEDDEENENRSGSVPPEQRTKRARSEEMLVPSADDDLSYRIVRPSARAIMTRLENTLTILHNNQVAGINPQSDASDTESDAASLASSRTRGRKRAQQKATSASSDDSSQDGESEVQGADSLLQETRNKNKPWRNGAQYPKGHLSKELYVTKHIRRWRQRDWRDVLNAAALAGFSPDVLARASQRCADLFGEGTSIHNMTEAPAKYAAARTQTVVFRPGQDPIYLSADFKDDEESEEGVLSKQQGKAAPQMPAPEQAVPEQAVPEAEQPRAEHTEGTKVIGLLCPHPSCPRSKEAFGRNSNLNRHVQKVHGGQVPTSERTPVSVTSPTSGTLTVTLRGSHPCPYPTCIRSKEGYSRASDLTKHIKAQHGGKTEPEVIQRNLSRQLSVAEASRSVMKSEDGLYHCPFPACGRAEVGFTRAPNLVRHIELVHGKLAGEADSDDESMDDSIGESMDEMDGAVHVDGFLKPIKLGRKVQRVQKPTSSRPERPNQRQGGQSTASMKGKAPQKAGESEKEEEEEEEDDEKEEESSDGTESEEDEEDQEQSESESEGEEVIADSE